MINYQIENRPWENIEKSWIQAYMMNNLEFFMVTPNREEKILTD